MNGLVLKTSKVCGTSHSLKKSYFNFIVSRSVRNNRFNNMRLMVNSGDLMKEYAEASQEFNQEPKSQQFQQELKSQHFNQEPKSSNQFETEEEPFEFPKIKKDPKLANNIDERIGNITNLLDFPSDSERFVHKIQELRDENKPKHKQPYQPKKKIDPAMRTVLLFPGQGSQFVGMGKKLLQYPKTKEMFNIASNILGYDLLKVCMEGPKEVLNKTQNCQAAVVVSSLAAVEKMRHETPWAIENCAVTAGYSVGEISALVLAEALTFEDAIALVKVRADNMQSICNSVPSGMMSVAINKDSKYKFACSSAVMFCKQELKMADPICEVTNHLHSHLKVISGNNEALEFIARNAESFNLGKCVYLPVSGAFHSSLMKPAAKPILDTLKTLKIKKPSIEVYSNVTGTRYNNENDVKELMAKHVWKPVKWEQIMTDIYSRNRGANFPFTYEVGPGKQLGYLLVKNNGQAFKEYTSVDV